MMAKTASIIALEADPDDSEDFPVTEAEVEQALAERRLRGPQKRPVKEQVTVRLDRDLLAHLRAGGRGWQSRLNATLRNMVGL